MDLRLKLMFVGQENVGKTALTYGFKIFVESGLKKYKKLMKDSGGLNCGTTESVRIENFAFKTDDETYRLMMWDFAGEEHYYSTHSLFLTERAIYIIVYNINADPDASRLTHWLKMIKSHAPKSPIIIVGTHLDQVESKKKEKVRQVREDVMAKFHKRYPKLAGVYGVSVVSGLGMKELIAGITDIMRGLDYLKTPVPPSYLELEKNMLSVREFKFKEWESSAPLIEWATVDAICNKARIPEYDKVNSIQYLEELGILVYCRGSEINKSKTNVLKISNAPSMSASASESYSASTSSSSSSSSSNPSSSNRIVLDSEEETPAGFVILDPQWVTQMFATVVIKRADSSSTPGTLSLKFLKENVWCPPFVPPVLHVQLLRVLERFEIIFPYPSGEEILVPSLLPKKLSNFQKIWPAHDPHTIQFSRHYDFSFIPFSIFSRFIIRSFKLKCKSKFWETGILLEDDEGCLCLVQYQPTLSRITLSARSTNKDFTPVILFCRVVAYLDALLDNTFREKAKILLPCPSCVAAQSYNPTLFTKDECEVALAKRQKVVVCEVNPEDVHMIPLYHVAPDFAMADFESLSIDVNKDVKLGEVLGEGAFATVHLGHYNNKKVAVKVLKIKPDVQDKESLAVLNEFRREVRVMSRLQHINVMELIAYSIESHPLAMVLELISFGSLYKFIRDPVKKAKLTWELKMRMVADINAGMAFLHGLDPPIIHRDLKSPNVMIASDDAFAHSVAKIADFGLSKELLTDSFKSAKAADRDVANPTWLAPEILKVEPNGKPADVYAFGIIMWEVLTQQQPFGNYEFVTEQERAIKEGERPPLPPDCPFPYKLLMEACWHDNPDERPTFQSNIQYIIEVCKEVVPSYHDHLKSLVNKFKPDIAVPRRASSALIARPSRANLDDSTPLSTVGIGLTISGTAVGTTIGSNEILPNFIRRRLRKAITSSPLLVKETNAYKPRTSINIRNRWKPLGEQQETVVPKVTECIYQLSEQILACPFPAQLTDTEWSIFSSLLMHKYRDRYKIFNLSGQKYDYAIFDGVVVEYPMDPDEPPPMESYLEAIEDVENWVSRDPSNVALIHCSGKYFNRTELVAAAVLLKLKNAKDMKEAESKLSKTLGMQIKNPGQKRYLSYYNFTLSKGLPRNSTKFYLHKMRFTSIPNFKIRGGCDPCYAILQNGKKIFFSKKLKGKTGKSSAEFFCRDILISGDVKIEFYHKSYEKKMFSLNINTSFEILPPDQKLVFNKVELDKACLDTSKKHFSTDFSFEVFLLEFDQIQTTRSIAKKLVGNSILKKFSSKASPNLNGTDLSLKERLKQKLYFPSPNQISNTPLNSSVPSTSASASASASASSSSSPSSPPPPTLPVCPTCRKLVKPDQISIEIMVGVSIHLECMKCAKCGFALEDDSRESVIKGGEVICSQCDVTIFPSCYACKKRIQSDVVTFNEQTWHDKCFECSRCGCSLPSIAGASPVPIFKSMNIYCTPCSTVIKDENYVPRVKSKNEEELETMLAFSESGYAITTNLGLKFFTQYLQTLNLSNLMDFYVLAAQRSKKSSKLRSQSASEYETTFLSKDSKTCLPSSILTQLIPRPKDTSLKEYFDQAMESVFIELSDKHYPSFLTSPTYQEYMNATKFAPDFDEDQDGMRRFAAEQFFAINPNDLSDRERVS
eukprot:TRINITY_DN1526_c0_g2_i6.p1 TRINITY_DN1526_c0_g2~~TRINITY_DN1526_c0_g2_i6.p1  ORF type:complete len:1660 (-),score=387.66 TRINITY_DN1526_c0_g2_i6:980-5959(-)